MQKQGKVVRWEADRGFGFIRSPDTDTDVFFHVRDFRGHGAPALGLAVVFEEIHVGGRGARAMAVRPLQSGPTVPSTRAKSPRGRQPSRARPFAPRANTLVWPWMLLAALMAWLMLWAVRQGHLPVGLLMAWPLVNVLTFWLYWRDKYAAQQGAWRTSEATLHQLSLFGGWPAARLAQQLLRHKSAKAHFQAVYRATVFVNVAVLMVWVFVVKQAAWPPAGL